MSESVQCKDCRHSFRPLSNILTWGLNSEYSYMCRLAYHPEKIEENPVVGTKLVPAKYDSCGIARIGRDDRPERCGEQGIFWEPKNKKDLFKFIRHVGA